MVKLLLIISFSVCAALAADTVTVQPEVDYPIINVNSLHNWQSVRTECLPPTEKDPAERCSITKLGDLGKIDDKNFYFVLYEWLDKKEADEYDKSKIKYPRSNTAIVLFYSTEDAPNMLRPFYADRTDLNIGWFEEPRIIRGSQGVLLKIPHRTFTNAASGQKDDILSWQVSNWRLVDTQSWVDDLQARLPDGCSVIRETLVNFEQMTASNYLWKKSDENCCPTCGRFSAKLAVEEDRLVIKDLQHNMKARLR